MPKSVEIDESFFTIDTKTLTEIAQYLIMIDAAKHHQRSSWKSHEN